MRKLNLIIAVLVMAVSMFNCKPDTKMLEQARQEGKKEGYDSALKTLLPDTLNTNSITATATPPENGHVHDGDQKLAEMISNDDFKKGVLAISNGEQHSSSSFKIVEYLPFVNPNNIRMVDDDRIARPNHGHFDYDKVETYVIDGNGNIKSTINVALIKKRR